MKSKKRIKVKNYNVADKNEIVDKNEDINIDELKADQILIKVDIRTGKVLIDNLEKFWRNFGVISIPNFSSKIIELSAYTHGNYKNDGGNE